MIVPLDILLLFLNLLWPLKSLLSFFIQSLLLPHQRHINLRVHLLDPPIHLLFFSDIHELINAVHSIIPGLIRSLLFPLLHYSLFIFKLLLVFNSLLFLQDYPFQLHRSCTLQLPHAATPLHHLLLLVISQLSITCNFLMLSEFELLLP